MKTTNELWKRNREEVQSDIATSISRIKMTNPSQSNDQVIFEAIASHYRNAEGASEYDFFKELEEETGWRKFGLGLKWGARIMTGLPIIAAVTAPVAKALSLEAFGKGVMYGVPTAAAAAGGSYIAYQRAYENHQTI